MDQCPSFPAGDYVDSSLAARVLANRPLNEKHIVVRLKIDSSNSMNLFFDLDQIGVIERSCGHYVSKPISCRRPFELFNGVTNSPRRVTTNIFTKQRTK